LIPSSYKKWVEQTGARPIVIPHFASKKLLSKLITQINGLLFIGGAPELINRYKKPTYLMRKLELIYKLALKENERTNGNFPVWGTCLGFEALVFAQSNYKIKVSQPNSLNELYSIKFMKSNYDGSLFSKYMTPSIVSYLEDKNVTYFNHHHGFAVEDFQSDVKLSSDYKVIAYYEKLGKKFVVAIQHKKYPIIGVQFHPEKVLYEHKNRVKIRLTMDASIASQEMSRMLFGPSLMNPNMFDSPEVLNHLLFESFSSVRTKGMFESVFLFSKEYFHPEEMNVVPTAKVITEI
jgi:gamma-glutamyl hydrolase